MSSVDYGLRVSRNGGTLIAEKWAGFAYNQAQKIHYEYCVSD